MELLPVLSARNAYVVRAELSGVTYSVSGGDPYFLRLVTRVEKRPQILLLFRIYVVVRVVSQTLAHPSVNQPTSKVTLK